MEWVKVEDRLPHQSDISFLVTDGFLVDIGFLEESEFVSDLCNLDITHWMDLPKPPS